MYRIAYLAYIAPSMNEDKIYIIARHIKIYYSYVCDGLNDCLRKKALWKNSIIIVMILVIIYVPNMF